MRDVQLELVLGHRPVWVSVLDCEHAFKGAPTFKVPSWEPINLTDELKHANGKLSANGVYLDFEAILADGVAWGFWVASFRCLLALEDRLYSGDMCRRGPTATPAEGQMIRYLDCCRPRPVTLPATAQPPYGVFMPNGFTLRAARLSPPTPAEWQAHGLTAAQVAASPNVRSVRDWWVLVFASAAIQVYPRCRRCSGLLPPSPTGRRSRRDYCRACRNRSYYNRQTLSPAARAKRKAAWNASKRRNRAAPKNGP